ncbi:MAG: 50S ribosomal protein L17 [Omnitrophica bacterium RBG_13_46_9]|nr:MAG: 50S ribosomal protein L17 [Omnitrophica bacterium RBG_13_46_9]
MRHGKRRTRFGRQHSHRIATLRNLARAVFLHQRIKTTHTKAKEAGRVVEKLITIAKKDSLAARRRAFAALGEKALVTKLFKEIAPLFKERKGGYTRIIPFNFRKGDGASIVFLELTEKKPEEKSKPEKKKKTTEKAAAIKEAKKEPPKAAPELAPEVKEEKTVEEVKKEKAKDEIKKIKDQKGFLRKVHGFFRRKTNM